MPVLLLQPLVENAIRHGLAEHLSAGRIEVVASRQDSRLLITVTDDGLGPATPAASGRQQVGLGNTRARLEALCGSHQRLDLAHAAPRGARVSLEIPFRTSAGRAMSLRVLIVDDEAVARRRIRRLLAADPDVTIVGDCADGASAVRAIAAERPDLASLDVQMPELDGFGGGGR